MIVYYYCCHVQNIFYLETVFFSGRSMFSSILFNIIFLFFPLNSLPLIRFLYRNLLFSLFFLSSSFSFGLFFSRFSFYVFLPHTLFCSLSLSLTHPLFLTLSFKHSLNKCSPKRSRIIKNIIILEEKIFFCFIVRFSFIMLYYIILSLPHTPISLMNLPTNY
jgi:hypothetical protein